MRHLSQNLDALVLAWVAGMSLLLLSVTLRATEPVTEYVTPLKSWGKQSSPWLLVQDVQVSETPPMNEADVWLKESPSYGTTTSDDGPDVSDPGPDMGDFPNSAFTLKKGRVQLEVGPASFRTGNANIQAAYGTPFLFRYGLTDDVEFRISGTGFSALLGNNGTTGFGVLVLDTKIHLWDAQMDRLIPAVAFEAYLQTEVGSPAFRAGTEPSLNLNLDFPLTERTNFETTLAYSGNLISIGSITGSAALLKNSAVPSVFNEYFFSFQWAVEHEVTDTFELFVHGLCNVPLDTPDASTGVVIGAGFFQKISKQLMIFGSANAGVTSVQSPFLGQLGLAYAF